MTESCGGREGRRCRGSLTTTALIGTMLPHLMRDRRPWELVRDDPQRSCGGGRTPRHRRPGLPRTPIRPVTLAGNQLPAGATALVAYGSADRDERSHDRPGVLDVTGRCHGVMRPSTTARTAARAPNPQGNS
ncbi:hypothetical protein [Streptomyces xantholiticus]|uniref:Uncharacterized protein n=1 Tax=Streptomyces xantholiticus TaxID=68285 RepID=A0ABV1UTX2_9ACTN